MDYAGRVINLRRAFESLEIDALLVTSLTNVRYLTGFSGTNAQALVTADKGVFFTDPRYRARATELVRGAEVAVYPNKLTELLGDHLDGVRLIGVEGGTMTLAQHEQISSALEGTELKVTADAVEDLRRVKEPAEVELIRQAVGIADDAFSWILERIGPGAVERDVALDLEVRMRSQGAEDVSFEPIVGSGPLSAHIHHTAGERVFERGELVLMDFGARVDGYCSDMTRTVVIGTASDEQSSQYEIVLAAQQLGIDAAATDAVCAEVDAAARNHITGAGFGDYFAHGLGHGVGLDIHEAPRLGKLSEDALKTGEVVTVEPGIYLDGGGIRIEDCVLIGSTGAEILTRSPKNKLIEL